jgi:hypothetical protein
MKSWRGSGYRSNGTATRIRLSDPLPAAGRFWTTRCRCHHLAGVRSVWLRRDLETFRKRLKALEAKSAKEHIVLTEEQLRAMELAREEREALGEIETAHPGYLGAQDTYYVSTIKSVGRIYQQTFLDTYGEETPPRREGRCPKGLRWRALERRSGSSERPI